MQVNPQLGPRFHKQDADLAFARDVDRHRDVGVLMLHYQVASDSLGGATSNSKMSKLAYGRQYVHYIDFLDVCKNSIIIFCSL